MKEEQQRQRKTMESEVLIGYKNACANEQNDRINSRTEDDGKYEKFNEIKRKGINRLKKKYKLKKISKTNRKQKSHQSKMNGKTNKENGGKEKKTTKSTNHINTHIHMHVLIDREKGSNDKIIAILV